TENSGRAVGDETGSLTARAVRISLLQEGERQKVVPPTGGQGGECVEVAHTADGGRVVRDSENRDGGLQFYAPAVWAAFIDGVKAGVFSG
ncbi:DUF397 domain-containing protein, partial [Streptomyces atratus]|uniref:DUF397 domain-containing protein n=1 Tax=Streptomyces atratus TaxID=1893 RepID=UPI0033E7E0DF